MKTLKFNWFAVLSVMALSMSFVSCGGDNDDDDNNTGTEQGGGNSSSGNYIATNEVKTAVLNSLVLNHDVIVHEDFYYKYTLYLLRGYIVTYPSQRVEGEWRLAGSNNGSESYHNIGCRDIGKVNSITEIKDKADIMSVVRYKDLPVAQPQHGYAFAMKTEDGVKHLRVFIQSYKLDSEGALSQISVQYQLY